MYLMHKYFIIKRKMPRNQQTYFGNQLHHKEGMHNLIYSTKEILKEERKKSKER